MTDITGKKFGMLTALKRADDRVQNDGRHRIVWECICECGATKPVDYYNLVSGRTRSCGCNKNKAISESHIAHGDSKSRLYNIWTGIKTRCRNPNCASFVNYGARGIDLCAEWDDYSRFMSWAIHNGYNDELSIDRIDNQTGYCPSNCRWVTRHVQSNNKRNNRLFTINGVTRTLKEWAVEYGMNYKLVHRRIQSGWDIQRALKQTNQTT